MKNKPLSRSLFIVAAALCIVGQAVATTPWKDWSVCDLYYYNNSEGFMMRVK